MKEKIYNRRFMKAYCALYNGYIDLNGFAARIGMPYDEAVKVLQAFRTEVLRGNIKDPRDKYGWR